MGQKVHPLGFRLGIYDSWRAQWFAKRGYGDILHNDLEIRKFLAGQLERGEVARTDIERAGDSIRLVIHSGRPGMVIGKRGQGIEQLRQVLFKKFKKHVDISVKEVASPELSAQLVGANIAEQIVRRASFKRVMKKAGFAAMKAGAVGIKICCAGRLGGAEIARTEWLRLGSVPLHRLRSKIDYASVTAHTTYGCVGIKVWICSGSH
ncbi:30S ribosomal protein S3 [Candidatus Babeliales bacterium]|nr:30S ribosomal protein S3 [Candidatus Babeliales bacterium]